MKQKPLNRERIAFLKEESKELIYQCSLVEKEPQGRGIWSTVFSFMGLIPALIDLVGKLIDLLDGEEDG